MALTACRWEFGESLAELVMADAPLGICDVSVRFCVRMSRQASLFRPAGPAALPWRTLATCWACPIEGGDVALFCLRLTVHLRFQVE
jgi:hypothetical protein